MGWSLTLGRFGGTLIRLHMTFLLFLLAVGGAFYLQGGAVAAAAGVVFLALLFTCVVLHEFGHIIAARRYGVRTPEVVLLPIGGVARMERIPEVPRQEIVVALAGPAVNLVIAAALIVALGGLPSLAEAFAAPAQGLAARLVYANLFLALFNLLPAFPMDGGRVLRAALSGWVGFARGTRIAAGIGQGLAVVFGLLGLVGGNPILILVAAFIYLAAAAESRAAQLRGAASGVVTGDAMMTQFRRFGRDSRLGDAVDALVRTAQPTFPVCDGDGRPQGLFTREAALRALKARGPQTPVVEVMTSPAPTVGAGDDLERAARLLQENTAPAVAVVDADARLVGLVTRDTLGELARVVAATGDRRGGSWPAPSPRPRA